MKTTKCGMCRRPTVWTMGLDRILRCKNCNKPATPSLRANRCRHLFMDKTTKEFSESCVTGCGIVLSKEAIPIMKKMVESYNLHSKKENLKLETENQPKEINSSSILVPSVVEDKDL